MSEVCNICHFPLEQHGWMRLEAMPRDPKFGQLAPCPHNSRVQDRYLKRLSGLQGPEHDWRLAQFWDVAGREGVLAAAEAMRKRWTGWLALHGTFGTGKTWLLKALVNEAVCSGRPALFQTLPRLLDHLRAAFDPKQGIGFSGLFDRVLSVDVLALDEVDKYNPTDWAQEKLQEIVDHRYTHAHEMATLLAYNEEERVPGYLRSRMGQFVLLSLTCGDMRPAVKEMPF